MVQAFVVPLTMVAFLLASVTLKLNSGVTDFDTFDGIGLLIVTGGVFLMDWSKEKSQKVCIVDDD